MNRTRARKLKVAAALAVLALSACSKVPSGVIAPEEMAQLLADIHTGESVIDMNRMEFSSDSAKQAYKQSVYARHGVTAEQVDSSFGWYGRNISQYMEVYDRTIEILDRRLIETGNRIAADAALSIAGDSVDVWPNPDSSHSTAICRRVLPHSLLRQTRTGSPATHTHGEPSFSTMRLIPGGLSRWNIPTARWNI